MRLKKLEITGFKSFLDKSKMIFPHGISAVVGPNGCGKSNIVDALRWVMGEQSIKQLRGKSKEDIIFAGAAGKQKVNLAEVSLLIENNLESASEPLNKYTEIMITRRLYRSGESLYLINRQPCRLKDIHDLFLGSGTGKNSFAVIQQGNIGAITDASPEERRYFIEEAADITKYKTRKKETLAKIKSVKENLLRITDITTEIKRQINTLNRQAKKATTFKEYKKRIKHLDIRIAVWKFAGITQKINILKQSIQAIKDEHSQEMTVAATHEGELATLKGNVLAEKHRIEELRNRQYETRRLVDKYENDIKHFKTNIEKLNDEIFENKKNCEALHNRNAELSSEIEQVERNHQEVNTQMSAEETALTEDIREQELIQVTVGSQEKKLKALNARHMAIAGEHAKYQSILLNSQKREEDVSRRIKIVDEEEYTCQKKLAELTSAQAEILKEQKENEGFIEDAELHLQEIIEKLTGKKQRLLKHTERMKALEIERSRITSEYKTLVSMEEHYEWYKDGVKAVMESKYNDNNSILSVLADIITPESGYEKAIESALGELLQSVIVDAVDTGIELVHYLNETKSGRSSFIPIDMSERLIMQDHEPGMSYLTEHFVCPKEYDAVVKGLLSEYIFADSIDEAVELKSRAGGAYTIVTGNGELVTRQNVITGGENNSQVSILEKKNELRELLTAINANEEKIGKEEIIQQGLVDEITSYTEEEKGCREELDDIREEKNDIEKKRYVIGADIAQNERRLQITRLEQEQLSGEQIDIEEELETASKKNDGITDEIAEIERELKKNNAEHAAQLLRVENVNKKIVERRLKLTSLKAKSENYHQSTDRLESFLKEGKERYFHFEDEIETKKNTVESTEASLKKTRTALAAASKKMKDIVVDVDSAGSDFEGLEKQLAVKEKQIEQTKKRIETLLDKIREKQVSLTEHQMQRELLTNRIEEKYHHRLNQYQLEFAENEPADEELSAFEITVLETELNDLKVKINKMGDVNLGAISEFEELKTRYDFMLKQHDDLTASLEDLEKIIDKINSVSQDRFISTFNAINEKLSEVFSRLFEGGTAEMVLTDPSSPLETGVELMIKPPGKTLTRLSLLSGGEKALSAIAFVFSVFLIKPASFCIMDEIDAPLDDSNVVRFNNLVKLIGENSQILIITHNKLTMEFADVLFGVTMEKKGVSKIVSVNLTKSGALPTESIGVA